MKRALNEEIEIGISGIRKLTETLKNHYGFDIGVYSSTSLKRRVVKVMDLNNLKNLDALIQLLETRESFFPLFQKQLTVEGTEFFRDPALWRYLRDEIAPVLDRNHMKIKIWIPGCSTGEEVVSTAITLKNAGIYDKSVILATDLNKEIIKQSREVIYSNNKLEISENNYKRFLEDESADLSGYLIKKDKGFQFKDDLYSNIIYDVFTGTENLKIKGINVVLCRNYFIYFTTQYQEKLFGIFTANLSTNGYFAIGNKENITFCKDADKYALVNDNEKVYKKISA